MFAPFLPSLFLLVIIAIVVAIVVSLRRREAEGLSQAAEDAGMGTVKRLYFYGVSFVALMLAANGVVLLLRYILDYLLPGRVIAGTLAEQLSLGLALTIVGKPLWLLHWAYLQRQVRREPVETRSVSRKLYVYLVLGVGMALMAVAGVELLQWAFRADAFPSYQAAMLLVWGGLWWYHWRLETREGQPTPDAQTLRRLYVYVTVTYSLWMAAAGLGMAASGVLRHLYDSLFSVPVLLRAGEPLWGTGVREGVAAFVVGSAVWAWHWLYVARGDVQSTFRQVYLNIFAVLPGIVTILVSVTFILFAALGWGLGAAGGSSAAAHFRVVPSALAGLLVGLALWGYHWSVVQQESRQVMGGLPAARRAYTYILAGLGLATLVAAVITLVGTLLGFPVSGGRGLLTGADWWRRPIALALALLIVGVPVYGYFWSAAQRRARTVGREERASLSRRTLVYLALGVAMLGLLGGASHLLFLFLRGLMEGELSLAFLADARWSVGVIVATGTVLSLYWQVLREDQRAGAEERVVRKSVTVVAGEASRRLVPQIEAALGQRVRVIRALEPETGAAELSAEQIADIPHRVAAAPGRNVLLVLGVGEARVLSYD